MVFRGFLVQRRRRSSLRGRAQADVHVCLTVERSEGKSDGETERGECEDKSKARPASQHSFTSAL